jgi:hypothetical protein
MIRDRYLCPGLVVVVAAMALVVPGCVRRTMTISTAPQGARVILNDQEIGTSPVKVDFIWYGDYGVTLRKDGYEILQTHKMVPAPWYELPGIDFVSEVLWPGWIHDQRELEFELQPAGEAVSGEELMKNAEEMRERALFGED